MKFHMLASGSKGNAFILETETGSILIDCGTTKKYLTQSFETLNYRVEEFESLLITHDHSDHISQIKLFEEHPFVYTPMPVKINHSIVNPYENIKSSKFNILPIPTSHDADLSVGYIIEDKNKKIVYVTDTGYIREQDMLLMKDADVIVLESNHDPEMLMKTKRPYYIKQRILSDYGHLSNEKAGMVLNQIVTNKTQEIVLAHLSQEANTEALALETVQKYLNGYKGNIRVGKQYEIISGELK